jgi:hypothetical protein
MTEKPKSYMERMRETGENLAVRVPQAAHRARIYDLEDNGASDLAHRKRSLRESIATRKRIIADIQKRQAGGTAFPPRPQAEAEHFVAGHREAISRLKEKLSGLGPSVPLIAPMTRRVAREDRRRARKTRVSTERQS